MERLHDQGKTYIALDFPGFGESDQPPAPWAVENYLECVVQYLDMHNLAKVSAVVHSFGGRVLTKMLASEHAERVEKAVFIAPAVKRHEKTGIRKAAMGVKRIFELPLLRSVFPLVRKVGYKLIGGHDYLEASGVMKESFKLVTHEDPSPQLTGISTPTLVFWGTEDIYVPVGDAELMKQEMTNAEVVIYEGGRHAIHKTHAEQISHTLNAFL